MCKHFIPATLIAAATALPAHAITFVSESGAYIIEPSADFFLGTVDANGGSGSYQIRFDPGIATPFTATAAVALSSPIAGSFDDLTVFWSSLPTGGVLASTAIGSGITTLDTTFSGGTSQYLNFSWTNSNPVVGFGFDVSTPALVPLPTSYLLLGTALVGAGMVLRSRRA